MIDRNKGELVGMTFIDLTFDQTVIITEHFYPDFSLVDFLSRLGGSLGLWLGLGVMQISGILSTCIEHSYKTIVSSLHP